MEIAKLAREVLTACILCLLACPALAQGGKSPTEIASDLGTLLASEEPCGLRFDQPAIQTWIAGNAPVDDMGFASSLDTFTRGYGRQFSQMSPSAKTAACAAAAGTARRYGFIE